MRPGFFGRLFSVALLCPAALSMSAAGPAAAHEADRFTSLCIPLEDRDFCLASAAAFRALYKKAFQGDYHAQRDVAYSLSGGASGVVRDRVSACAWRLVIIVSGSPSVDVTDQGNVKVDCGRLSPAELAQAKAAAITISGRIAAGGEIDEEIIEMPPGLDGTAEPL